MSLPMPARTEPHLIDRLPTVAGRLAADAPLAPLTWFRTGGAAEVLFKPADTEDLAGFLAGCPDDISVTVLGVASNTLVRDGGIPGVTIRLGAGFARSEIAWDGDSALLVSGAAALDLTVARVAAEAGVGGLEFLSGIPGTLGGAVPTNAGAYGTELKDVLAWAEAVDRSGTLHRLPVEALGFGYRSAALPPGWIVTRLALRGHRADPALVLGRMGEIAAAREASQPIRARTGGSTFANPPGHKAWALVDSVGGRGLKLGGAQVSEKHCNFLLNTGTATAAELEALGELLRAWVLERHGIALHWEIRRIGRPLSPGELP